MASPEPSSSQEAPNLASALDRVIVVGTSGAGKSTFADRLARVLGRERTELDELHWDRDWQPKPTPRFRELVAQLVAQPHWIADGNYSAVRDLIWPRATTVVWLNYRLSTILWRLFWRTVARMLTRRTLWHGNRESFRLSFLSRQSILIWALSSFQRRRDQLAALQSSGLYPHLIWLEFRSPRDAEGYLRSLTGKP
jgi:adenylate kinase family enzyme